MSTIAVPAGAIPRSAEQGFRRVLWAASIIAALALVCHLGLLVWAHNAFSGPESVVAGQSATLARQGTLYNDLNHYPYTVCAYMPIFYSLEAALSKLGLAPAMAGRLVSFAAFLGIVLLCWRIAMAYTQDRYCAWLAALLAASTSLLCNWGTIGQVDMLGAFLSLAAFYAFSRGRFVYAGVFAGLAFFTKQTMLAASAAIFVSLWLDRPKRALRFGLILGSAVTALALSIEYVTGGRFFADAVRANLNPFALEKWKEHAMVLALTAPLVLVIAAGAKRAFRAARPLFVYLGFALAVLTVTAGKVGSDTNYQIESTVLLILCAAVALDTVEFFPLSFAGSKRWITLLQIPLAVYLVVNFRMTANLLLHRAGTEQGFRAEIAALRPYVDSGRLLSADYNASIQLRGGMEVEPLIYGELVDAGVVDPEPLRRDLAAQKFSTIVLFEDLDHPALVDAETSTLPAAQLAEIRSHYRLAAHVESPYSTGVFVYKPR